MPDVLERLTGSDEELFHTLAELRRDDPVHRTGKGFFLLTRYADITVAYQGTGSSFRSPDREEFAVYYPNVVHHRCVQRATETVLVKNPPEHTRLRRLVGRDFTPRRVEQLRPRIEAITGELLDPLAEPLRDGAVVDLHEQVAQRLPRYVFAALLGVPPEEAGPLSALIDITIGGLSPAATPDQLAAADAATEQVETYFAELFAKRRKEPRDDLISALVSRHADDEELTEEELMCILRSLWLPAFDTTTMTLDQGFLALLEHPELAHWLRGTPAEALAFTEEVLRHQLTVLVTAAARIATADIELSGVTIPAGADVRTVPLSGNRDAAAFPDPDRFDPSRFAGTPTARKPLSHLAFAGGIHYCLGAHLARTQTAVVLAQLARRFPGLTLAGKPVRHNTVLVRHVLSVPVSLTG